jgi:hypothetical protein
MTALAIWALRLIALFVIMFFALSLFSKKPGPFGGRQNKARRFDAKGKTVEDGDFKEL